MPYFCFWIKQSYMPNSMKKASSMSKDSNNLSKPHFGCYFHYTLVNFKNLIIFWNIWIIYGLWKSWRSIVFDLEGIRTPKMVKKVTMNLDLLEASGLDFIPVVVLKNCEPEFSYTLAELFSMHLKEFCFQDCWKVSLVIPVFKNVGERSKLKTTTLLVFFLCLVKSWKNSK